MNRIGRQTAYGMLAAAIWGNSGDLQRKATHPDGSDCFFTISNPFACNSRITAIAKYAHSFGVIQ
jgi:hypothetical protein